MAISIVQQRLATQTGTIALPGSVTAGNTLILIVSWLRGVTGASAVPTDTIGTWLNAVSTTGGNLDNSFYIGSQIAYQNNASSGSHTVTLASSTEHWAALIEVSGLATSAFDVATSTNLDKAASTTSSGTGSTASTAQNDELVIINMGLGASGGVADVGWSPIPVSGFTALDRGDNDSTSLAYMTNYKVISATGAQSATFNWTDATSNNFGSASIATFKIAGSSQSQAPRSMHIFNQMRA